MSANPPAGEAGPISLTVRVSAKVAHQLRSAAAREGQPPEAQAALWLEEHAEEVSRSSAEQR